jgi:hypothetical protein
MATLLNACLSYKPTGASAAVPQQQSQQHFACQTFSYA